MKKRHLRYVFLTFLVILGIGAAVYLKWRSDHSSSSIIYSVSTGKYEQARKAIKESSLSQAEIEEILLKLRQLPGGDYPEYKQQLRAELASSLVKARYSKENLTSWRGAQAAIIRNDAKQLQTVITGNPDVCKMQDMGGKTLLMGAIIETSDDQIVELLCNYSNVNATDNAGNTAAILAAQQSSTEIRRLLRLLVKHGADLNVANNGKITAQSLLDSEGIKL